MKKTLLLLAITMFSCSRDEMPEPVAAPVKKECYVERVTEFRQVTFNSSGVITSDSGYIPNGAREFYSKNCDDCGKVLPGATETQGVGFIRYLRAVTKCN